MRWAILGTGYVSRKFLLGLRASSLAPRVTVVASRTLANAQRFAAEFEIADATADYAAAVASPNVDVVYVATPPAQHAAHALAAIAQNKAVLVEKPFAMTATEARQIASAARAAGVFCMEAMWSRFLPLTQNVKANLDAGAIGDVRSFHGSFCVSDVPDPSANAFNAVAGGGALLGRCVYPVSLARHFLGPVASVKASARFGESGVDEDCALILTHRSGAMSTITASLRANGPNDGHVLGTHGRICISEPLYRPFAAELIRVPPRGGAGGGGRFERLKEGVLAQGAQQRLHGMVQALRRAGRKRLNGYYAGNGYHYEADAVMLAVRSGQLECPVMPLDESVEVMDIIDAARSSWRESAPT